MECYACDQEATRNCFRCGNAYCEAHGADPGAGGQALCAACLDPVSAAPSNAAFRLSLFALLIASVVALWLLVRPPGGTGDTSEASRPRPVSPQISSPSPSPAGSATAAPAAQPSSSPVGSPGASPAATPTPAAVTPTPAPTPPPTPAPPQTYTVQPGDTWYGLAATLGVSAEQLAAANGRTINDILRAGEVLTVPR